MSKNLTKIVSLFMTVSIYFSVPVFAASQLPLADGVYVETDVKPCEEAGQVNKVWMNEQSISYAHQGCSIVKIGMKSPSIYEVTKRCSYMSDPKAGEESMRSRITITGHNEFMEDSEWGSFQYRLCEPLTTKNNETVKDLQNKYKKSAMESKALVGASFDCAKTSTHIEKTICSDSSVSELDIRVAQVYKKALASVPDPNTLKAEQRVWLKTKRNKCLDAGCLLEAYKTRLIELTE